jgi:tryptophan synthase alpha chain
MPSTSSKLTEAILQAKNEQRSARVPFLTAGIPTLNSFWDNLLELSQNGADIIEIGIPFSDPVADGPVIAAASQKALDMGVTLEWLLEGLRKKSVKTPLVIMSYVNPLLRYAWEKVHGESMEEKREESLKVLARDLREANISGVIIPDVPLDEALPYRKAFSEVAIDLIALVGPNTTKERMKEYDAVATGYVYVVSVMGITGARDGLPPEAMETLNRAKEVFSLPLALGFGIKEPLQLKSLPFKPDAVIFGSALVKHLEDGKKVKDFMEPWLNS